MDGEVESMGIEYEKIRNEFMESFHDRIKAQKEEQRVLVAVYNCLRRFWDSGFRLAFTDMLRITDKLEIIHLVDTFELYNYAFPKIQPLSRTSEAVLDNLCDILKEKIFIPPYVAYEFIVALHDNIERLDAFLPEMTEIKRKRDRDRIILRDSVHKIVECVKRVSRLSRFYDPQSPLKRIEEFLTKYKPLELNEMQELCGKINFTIKRNPLYNRCLNSIEKNRWGIQWKDSNEIDAQTSALTLSLNNGNRQSFYFNVFSGSKVFENIIWKNDPFTKLPIGRRYLPLIIRTALQNVSDVKDIELKDYIEGFLDAMEDRRLPNKYRSQVMGGLSGPFSVFMSSLGDYLEEIKEAKISSKDLSSVPFKEIREYGKVSVEELKRLMIAMEEINELRSKALENLRHLYEEMSTFVQNYEQFLLPEQKDRFRKILGKT